MHGIWRTRDAANARQGQCRAVAGRLADFGAFAQADAPLLRLFVRVLQARGATGDRSTLDEAVKAERAAIEHWQTTELRMALGPTPNAADCDRLVDGLSHLALPAR